MRRCQTLGTTTRTLAKERSIWSHRNPKLIPANLSLSLPLLHDLDFESVSISSSGPDNKDHPRISLDFEKPVAQISLDFKKLAARSRSCLLRSKPGLASAGLGGSPPTLLGLSVNQGLERSLSSLGSISRPAKCKVHFSLSCFEYILGSKFGSGSGYLGFIRIWI